jgi:hypothetical protein
LSRLGEDVDCISNANKEDKMIISGLSRRIPKPTGNVEIRTWLKNIVSDTLEAIEPGSSKDIIFVAQGRSNHRDIPLAEVRMSSKETAIRIRKTFAKKEGWTGLWQDLCCKLCHTCNKSQD